MTFFSNTFSFCGSLKPRTCGGITFIGPGFFETDENGNLLSPIASVFPKYRTVITVKGIHAVHAAMMIDYLRQTISENGRGECIHEQQELDVYQDAVALLIRNSFILIRSDPGDMEHVFAADEMIQSFLPRERIQFTGLHLAEVRNKLRQRGESWRISPAPRSVQEICEYVRSSRVQVGTGLTVYYNAPTGGRFLTYAEFMRIRDLLHEDVEEAFARLSEIVDLFRRSNSRGNRELNFFLPCSSVLDSRSLEDAICMLQGSRSSVCIQDIESVFNHFADLFAKSAGAELLVDDETNAAWRNTMFCRLYDIDEQEMEECVLGLSSEFHLNVKWLPGAAVVGDTLRFDLHVTERVKGLIAHYWKRAAGFVSINVGRVESPQSGRDIIGEERDVYLAVIGTSDGQECIRLIRLMKWDVFHRIKMGQPPNQAIRETINYRNYIFDRLHAAMQLGFPTLSYSDIELEEEMDWIGKVPAFFFERSYVPGIVTNKIPLSYYRKPEFIVDLARLLGTAAAFALVLGKSSPRTGTIFYDDGDELIQFDSHCAPERLVIIETTGSFNNWTTPIISMLPQCLSRFRAHLQRALQSGVPVPVLNSAVAGFADALAGEISRVQDLIASPSIRDIFSDREDEPCGIRNRWDGILARLLQTDLQELRDYIFSAPVLDFKNRSRAPLP
jgi:hypothetical protein